MTKTTQNSFEFRGNTYTCTWLNDERTALSVVVSADAETIDDVRWPSDETVSEHVGRTVKFSDKGDDLCEAIYH